MSASNSADEHAQPDAAKNHNLKV